MQPGPLTNRITREEITFEKTSVDTRGRMLRLKIRIPPFEEVPIAHVHERQSERLTVLSGSLSITEAGATRVLEKGASVVFRPGMAHSWANRNAEWAEIRCELFPALNTEHFFKHFVSLVNSGRTRSNGKPSLLQAVQLMREYFIFSAALPVWLQKLAAAVLAPLAARIHARARSMPPECRKNQVPA